MEAVTLAEFFSSSRDLQLGDCLHNSSIASWLCMGSTEVISQCMNVLTLFISFLSLICILLGFCEVLMSQGSLNVVLETVPLKIKFPDSGQLLLFKSVKKRKADDKAITK